MLTNKLRKDQGFTIIEVMIVLAIAGMILLVVFLAVPALQRSSRNTQRKDDAAALLGAMNDYISNNSGALPTTLTWVAGPPIGVSLTGGTASAQGNVGYYTKNTATTLASMPAIPAVGAVTLVTGGATGDHMPATDDAMVIEEGVVCTYAGGFNEATTTGAGSRSFVALYDIETPGALIPQCTSS